MDEPDPLAGDARAEETHGLEPVIMRLHERLLKELEETENSADFIEAPPEQRMKILTGLFKALQGVEDMINQKKREFETHAKRGIDVVEFRRQLEEQIARLVEQENQEAISGGAE